MLSKTISPSKMVYSTVIRMEGSEVKSGLF